MQPHVRMLEQEGANGLCLMGREIVGDDMDLAPLRLTGDDVTEGIDERRTRVSRHGLSEHLAGLGIQRGEERQRAVPVVLEAIPFGAPGRQRQDGIEAV